MPVLKCPAEDQILEFVSIPQEISFFRRLSLKTHLTFCKKCTAQSINISKMWEQFFSPAPDLTSSLIKVYSKLQNDETLILKGWKVGTRHRRQLSQVLVQEGWLFRGAISVGLVGLISLAVYSQMKNAPEAHLTAKIRSFPLAQIRYERPNHVQVHYMQPELLESVEFETTNGVAE